MEDHSIYMSTNTKDKKNFYNRTVIKFTSSQTFEYIYDESKDLPLFTWEGTYHLEDMILILSPTSPKPIVHEKKKNKNKDVGYSRWRVPEDWKEKRFVMTEDVISGGVKLKFFDAVIGSFSEYGYYRQRANNFKSELIECSPEDSKRTDRLPRMRYTDSDE